VLTFDTGLALGGGVEYGESKHQYSSPSNFFFCRWVVRQVCSKKKNRRQPFFSPEKLDLSVPRFKEEEGWTEDVCLCLRSSSVCGGVGWGRKRQFGGVVSYSCRGLVSDGNHLYGKLTKRCVGVLAYCDMMIVSNCIKSIATEVYDAREDKENYGAFGNWRRVVDSPLQRSGLQGKALTDRSELSFHYGDAISAPL
jgi:hypothetical protein